jgi:ribulose-5-phosphate 4-epimerase/fuculose-1-phosphate aldolase
MKNHGVLVTGDTVAQAYRRLYKLERVCRNQVLALSTGGRSRCSPRRSWHG